MVKCRVNIAYPETNSKFAPEHGWLEYIFVSVLERLGLSSEALAVCFREGTCFLRINQPMTSSHTEGEDRSLKSLKPPLHIS